MMTVPLLYPRGYRRSAALNSNGVDHSHVGVFESGQLTLTMFVVLISVDFGRSFLASRARYC